MIELREVTKTFTEEKAVDQLALRVKKGSIFGLLGSNGAGKTTLLKIIAGIYRPDAGKVLIGGQSVYEQPEVKQHILFMPDTPYFFRKRQFVRWPGFTAPFIRAGARNATYSLRRFLS